MDNNPEYIEMCKKSEEKPMSGFDDVLGFILGIMGIAYIVFLLIVWMLGKIDILYYVLR